MEWAAGSDEVILQRLNRLQNTDRGHAGRRPDRHGPHRPHRAGLDLGRRGGRPGLARWRASSSPGSASATGGTTSTPSRATASRSRLVTKGNFDVLEVEGIDDKGGWLYYVASPDNPTQKYLFRTRLDGKGKPERITPRSEPGTHGYDRVAQLQVRDRDLLEPGQRRRSSGWSACRATRSSAPWWTTRGCAPAWPRLRRGPVEWLIDSDGRRGQDAGACCMKPADFDSTRKYPLLFFVYGGPGNAEVEDQWGGYYLWHTMLTQKGYLVAIVDNRGTPAPLGRAWRKAIYGQMGVLETRDQAAAARALMQRPYVDASRVGIWGWSYGGFMTLERAVPAPRHLPDGRGRLAGDALVPVRQRLHRAVQRAYHRQPRGLRPRLADQLRGRVPGQSAPGARRRRRQRAFPEQRDSDQRAGGRQQAVPDDGISQPDALRLPGQEHRRSTSSASSRATSTSICGGLRPARR